MSRTFTSNPLDFSMCFSPSEGTPPPDSTPPLSPASRVVFVPMRRGSTTLPNFDKEEVILLQPSRPTCKTAATLYALDAKAMLPDNAMYTSPTLFDLLLCSRRMTPTQRCVIRVLKIRAYDARCVLWEGGQKGSGDGVARKVWGLLKGLETGVVVGKWMENKRRVEVVRGVKGSLVMAGKVRVEWEGVGGGEGGGVVCENERE